MQERAMMNAMRSALVVIGTAAFGYLNFHLGFKPFLEKAAQQQIQSELSEKPTTQHDSNDHQFSDNFKMEVHFDFKPFLEEADQEQNQPHVSEEPTTQQGSDEKFSDNFE